ncbi:25-Hydroxyvitamin D-1 Alpha Hydroxylase [Manis pentadactyla]|nr:25-Hydroxyvitamin D-1 Alpha Hydroxylase [Manis pentadactyla]
MKIIRVFTKCKGREADVGCKEAPLAGSTRTAREPDVFVLQSSFEAMRWLGERIVFCPCLRFAVRFVTDWDGL